MADNDYSYWHEELAAIVAGFTPSRDKPGLMRRDEDRPKAGFWRMIGARTKWDAPVAIWYEDGVMRIKIGRKDPQGEADNDFISIGFTSCAAVLEADYKVAIETGKWVDGKLSRDPAKEKPAEPAVTAPPSPAFPQVIHKPFAQPTNAAPDVEALTDQIENLASTIRDKPEPTTQAEADALSGLLDRMKLLLKEADTTFTIEKKPFLDGGREVDARWAKIRDPGRTAYADGDKLRRAFLKKQEAVAEPEAPKAATRSEYGRATTLRNVRKGVITDKDAFIKAIAGPDLDEYLQGRADALARSNIELAGMRIDKDRE